MRKNFSLTPLLIMLFFANAISVTPVYGYKLYQKVKLNDSQSKVIDYEKIDNYAKNTPKIYNKTVSSLAQYLSDNFNSDIEKARVIYSWLAYHIKYDDDSYNSSVQTNSNPENVLTSLRAFCDGFSGLYQALGKEMGLEVIVIAGHAKGYAYNSNKSKIQINHAWNAIKIDGKWRLFDATWGAGFGKNVNGELQSVSKFDDTWFDINPYFAIFNHFPTDQKWTLLNRSISSKEYNQLPDFNSNMSDYIPDFKQLFEYYITHLEEKPPLLLNVDLKIKLYKFPKSQYLKKNQSYNFKIYGPEIHQIAIIDANKNWSFFKNKNGYINITYKPVKKGKLNITIQDKNSSNDYSGLLEYIVN